MSYNKYRGFAYAIAVACAVAAVPTTSAADMLKENFSAGIPDDFILSEGPALAAGVYAHTPDNCKWFEGRLPGGNGACALAPTRRDDPQEAACSMTLPKVHVTPGALMRWDARSLHAHLPESYNITVRRVGSDDSYLLYLCSGENHWWTTHSVSLVDYEGSEVEICITATTEAGFMLAVDNIFVGTPTEPYLVLADYTKRFPGSEGGNIDIAITNHGAAATFDAIRVANVDGDLVKHTNMEICSGDTYYLEHPIWVFPGYSMDYTVIAERDGQKTTLGDGFVAFGYYPRNVVIDRMSGLWCNNCPVMDLTTKRLERYYGDQLTVLESHVNDILTNGNYWSQWMSEFVYSVPMLVPNHDRSNSVYKLQDSDFFGRELSGEGIFAIKAHADFSAPGSVRVDAEAECAFNMENTGDRYRIGAMVIADIHNPENNGYIQSSMSGSYLNGQYYYQPDYIAPQMMYFTNVPIETSRAVKGIPNSLPAQLPYMKGCPYSFTINYTATDEMSNIRVLVLVIDRETGIILNSAIATTADEEDSVPGVANDSSDGQALYFDLQGRRVYNPDRGLYIEYRNGKATKIIK